MKQQKLEKFQNQQNQNQTQGVSIPKKQQQHDNVKKIQHLKKVNIHQRPQDMLSKVQKCTKSTFTGKPKKQKNLDLFKLPGSDYIKPGLLTKTKDQLANKNDAFKTSNVKQKPSCELFAPQPKRVFTKDYSNAIPKHLLTADNKVKPPVKLVNKRKFVVKKPEVKQEEVDIFDIVQKDMLKNKLQHANDSVESFKANAEPALIMWKLDDPRKSVAHKNNVVSQNQRAEVDHQRQKEKIYHSQNQQVHSFNNLKNQSMDSWMENVMEEFAGVSGIPRVMKEPPMSLQDRARQRGINLLKRPSSPERRDFSNLDHKKIKLSSPQIQRQQHGADTKEKDALLQKDKCLKRKFQDVSPTSRDLEGEFKIKKRREFC